MLLDILQRMHKAGLRNNECQIKISVVSRLRNLDIKCDDRRALGTPPEDHDGSGIETEEGSRRTRRNCRGVWCPEHHHANTEKQTIIYSGAESYSYREYFL